MSTQINNNTMSFGCCDFQLYAQDLSVICARSMEFPLPMDSKLLTFNKSEWFKSEAPGNTEGVKWFSKYGCVGINAFNDTDLVDEGMNEKGLSFGCLTLRCSEYQCIPQGENKKALSHLYLGLWILTNFATVEEVKEHIDKVYVWGQYVPALNSVPGLHFAIHDADGHNLVIEFIKGQIKLQDNPIGILTNDPPLKWQHNNLAYYNHLTPKQAPDVVINGVTIKNKESIGSGLIGLPGDYSPESRFVRIAYDVRVTTSTMLQNSEAAFIAATHILNRVDKLKGAESYNINGTECFETTLWATIKDLTKQIFYFRSYNDMTFREVDLKKLNFSPLTLHKPVPIQASKPTIIDISCLI